MKSILFLFTAALAFGQTAVIGQPAQPTAFDCAIDGSVVNALTGEAIPRARISINTGGASSSAAADSSGKWNLSNVACGATPVTATRPGFLSKASRPVTLRSGAAVHDVKIELTPQSVFYGEVLDDQGDPVVGAQIAVFASRVVDGRINFQRAGGGSTNDLGDYRVAGLPHGKYVVCSNLASGPARAGEPTAAEACYPGPVEGGAATAMEIPAGRETRVDLALNQTPTVHVRGMVSGIPQGRGAGINLVKRGANAAPGGIAGGVNNNYFDFRVPPGSYTLTGDYFESGKHLLARVPIEVGTSDIDNVGVTLDGGLTIAGVVSIASQSGQTAARQEFAISLRPLEPTSGAGQAKWSADHSSFAFSDMTPGNYRLDIVPPAPFYVKSATLAGQDVLNSEFALSQTGGPIEIVLSDDGGSIEGDMVNADGQPATGGVMALRNGRAFIARSTGHFKLQNLAPGDYSVYAWDDPAEVAYADTDWMRHYAGSGVTVTVTSGQNSQVKLTQQKVPE